MIKLDPTECWWRICCHHCGFPNWVLDTILMAVEEDYSYAVHCCQCHKAFWFDVSSSERPQDIYEVLGLPDGQNIEIVEGRPRPRKERKPNLKFRKDLQT
jgi:hypothetical protein